MPYSALLRGRWSAPGQVYLVTTATSDRRRVFMNFDAGCIVAREIVALDRAGLALMLAWVLMPDHMHLLARLDGLNLPSIMRRLKGRSSRAVHRLGLELQPLWQHGYQDRAVRRDEDMVAIARYVCANPLRAGLVATLRDYPFWDCCWIHEGSPAEAGPTSAGASG